MGVAGTDISPCTPYLEGLPSAGSFLNLQKHASSHGNCRELARDWRILFFLFLITIPFFGAFFFRGLILKPTCKEKACQGRQSENTAPLAPILSRVLHTPLT